MSPASCPRPPDFPFSSLPGLIFIRRFEMRTVLLRLHVPDKPASDVYRTLADFERYPELSDAVRSVVLSEVSENRTVSRWEVTFRAGLLRWTEEDTFDPAALS